MSAMNDDNDDDADDDNVAMMMMKVSVLPITPNYTKTIRCNPKHSNEMQCTACMHQTNPLHPTLTKWHFLLLH